MAPRYFSLSEAEALLSDLIPRMLKLQERSRRLQEVQEQLAALVFQRTKGNGHPPSSEQAGPLEEAQERLTREIEEGIEEIHGWGCEVKGLEEGLVDFRTLREGHEGYLCWKLGEERISHWHDLESGFAGRQPL